MTSLCRNVQRLLLPLWVGAAILFVITSVAEQTSANFTPVTKNQLALVRFPKYYAFGFAAVTAAFVAGAGCFKGSGRKCRVATALVGVALLLMLADYFAIYGPLESLMLELDRPRDADFRRYHQLSKYINAIEIVLCSVAAVLVCAESTRPKID